MQPFNLHGALYTMNKFLLFSLFWGSRRRAQGTDIILHGGGLIYWELEKDVEMDTLLHRGPVKNHGGVCSPGTLER
jgi:hypothetical protein